MVSDRKVVYKIKGVDRLSWRLAKTSRDFDSPDWFLIKSRINRSLGRFLFNRRKKPPVNVRLRDDVQ